MTKSLLIGLVLLAAQFTASPQQPKREQPQAAEQSFVGTWEFVSATKADGTPNQAYDRAHQGRRALKMITPTHFALLYIDLATGRITGGHGGTCQLKEGRLTECQQYSVTPSANLGTKTLSFAVRCEGDRFIQTWDNGGVETWRRASTAMTSGGTTLGQQLVDLQKAKDAGALTDAEYNAQKAKLLEKK